MYDYKENIADKLLNQIDQKKNPCVVGLDPILEQIPECVKRDSKEYKNPFEAVRDTIIEFNKLIIDAIADIVPAVKPQMAFYEKYGSEGVKAFEQTVEYAKGMGLIVIEDAKRSDIGHTVKAYAEGHLGKVLLTNGTYAHSYNVDFMTVNPYLGSDGLLPFVEACKKHSKGIFVLVKTSNPSSGELQNKLVSDAECVYDIVAKYVYKVGEELIGTRGYSAVGAVVGATYPDEARKLRKTMPNSMFLVPGYGAQGGKADDVIYCFNEDGYGAVVSSSRSILYAYNREGFKNRYKPEEFSAAAREAAIRMRDNITKTLKKHKKLPSW